MPIEFTSFGKIARLSREVVITEKIDGSNAAVRVAQMTDVGQDDEFNLLTTVSAFGIEYGVFAQSRKKMITADSDNYGFAKWVIRNAASLVHLGEGIHFGEWWGNGINAGYGLKEKRFSLFNTHRWNDDTKPDCCSVVPVLARGLLTDALVEDAIELLLTKGSQAAPGSRTKPEGIVIYHTPAGTYFKKTLEDDDVGKEESIRRQEAA